ncbi:MAG: glycosyltransferase family 39 protein [Lachnospiraceae bacterium]|nr:glycosyltransferase family 39 protein [Lachnospiraceae bacterium]
MEARNNMRFRKIKNEHLLKTLWFLFCFILAVIVRTYKLSDIPYGIHIDEAGMGYDAWTLQKYHVDRWLHHFPVYLTNFGNGQSSLYAYLCAMFIKIFGKGEWNVIWLRMPGVAINLAGYVAGLHIIGKIFEEKWKLLSAFILAVLPYFIMQCRFGMDCNLLVNMLTISLCLLCFSLEYRKTWMFLLTGVFYGLTYYAYALSYIPNTLLLLLITIYLFWKDKGLWNKLFCVWIPASIIAFPLVLMILVNQFDLPQIELGFITITKLPGYRVGEFAFALPKIFKNSGIVLSCILTKDEIDYNAFDKFYTMYRVSIPFIILGFCDSTKHIIENLRKQKADIDYSFFLWSTFILYFILGCCLEGDVANVNKMNGIFFSQFFLLLCGIRKIYDWFEKTYITYAKIFIVLLCVVYLFDFVSFTHYYFVKYPTDIYPQSLFADTYEGILGHLQEKHLDDKPVYIFEYNNYYIYYMLGAECDPYEVNLPDYGTNPIKNIYFGVFDQIEASAVYIIRETDAGHIQQVKELGLELQYAEGMYQCYYKDL